jgi:hypothetical protein
MAELNEGANAISSIYTVASISEGNLLFVEGQKLTLTSNQIFAVSSINEGNLLFVEGQKLTLTSNQIFAVSSINNVIKAWVGESRGEKMGEYW